MTGSIAPNPGEFIEVEGTKLTFIRDVDTGLGSKYNCKKHCAFEHGTALCTIHECASGFYTTEDTYMRFKLLGPQGLDP